VALKGTTVFGLALYILSVFSSNPLPSQTAFPLGGRNRELINVVSVHILMTWSAARGSVHQNTEESNVGANYTCTASQSHLLSVGIVVELLIVLLESMKELPFPWEAEIEN